ncbi:MAG: hypothetical protein JWO86_5964 [Myxococcaceae bacterium]|jgi:hypothetical protein|nr:hypothetical protein [Myxococcaceae bacterium]MEA2748914.1 hypothetical protein [Myxococcales bacterium]
MNKSSMNNPSSSDADGKIVDQAKQAVTHVASNVASQAKEQVNAQFDTRKDKAVETIGNVASAIRETSDKLKGVGPLGDAAGRAADGIERVAEFFEGKQIGDVVKDVERFARREPALFIGAAFALGLIGGRFLKSSAHRSSGSDMGGEDARAGGSYGRSSYDRYEPAYGSSAFGDDDYDYLSEADLQDDVDSQRFGSSGAQRAGRTTQPMGSRTGSAPTSTGSATGSPRGSSQGSSFGATQGSPQGSSFGTSTGSGSSEGSSGTSTATTKTASNAPAPTATSGSATPKKNGLGGGNTGSV